MIYADFDYYSTVHGGALAPSEFNRFAHRASAYIDMQTLNRITEATDNIRRAMCEIVDLFYDDFARGGGGITSENNDGYSVSYGGGKAVDRKAYDIVRLYLANTDLLYRGIG